MVKSKEKSAQTFLITRISNRKLIDENACQFEYKIKIFKTDGILTLIIQKMTTFRAII